jgi:hypothetical protein
MILQGPSTNVASRTKDNITEHRTNHRRFLHGNTSKSCNYTCQEKNMPRALNYHKLLLLSIIRKGDYHKTLHKEWFDCQLTSMP